MAEIKYTVTHLEMTEQPKGPPPARPDEPLRLEKNVQPTVCFYRYLYDAVGGDYQWMDLRDWPSEKLARFIQNPAVDLSVLYRRGVPIGMYQLDRRTAGVCDLTYLGLTPEARGRRIGHWLFWVAVEEAWTPPPHDVRHAPLKRVTHRSCTLDHPRSQPLLRQLGFKAVCRQDQRRHIPPCPDVPPAGLDQCCR